MRIMSLDIGTKRIGVALSDELQIISQPYKTIQYDNRKLVFAEIESLIKEKNVGEVIAGLPLNLAGEFSEMSKFVESFIKKLEKKINMPVERVDERYSSQEAEKHMQLMGRKPSKNKADIDKIAAAILLREYLQEKG